ncbi:MAG: glycosyl hydrolase [Planctomycetota bacterium]
MITLSSLLALGVFVSLFGNSCVSDPPPKPNPAIAAGRRAAVEQDAGSGAPPTPPTTPTSPATGQGQSPSPGRVTPSTGGGRNAAGRSARAGGARRGGVAAAEGQAGAVISVTGGPADYGAPLEPPAGRVLHGMGQWQSGNIEYLAALGETALQPASQLSFIPVGDWPRDWDSRHSTFRKSVLALRDTGRLLHLDVTLYGLDSRSGQRRSVDGEIARTTEFDARIADIAKVLVESGQPVFVRIGAEFNGEWNGYEPFDYPAAYRRVVEIFRREGVTKAAFIWCYEPSAPEDFGDRDPQRGWLWYPGDDVVDWFGLDLFGTDQFTGDLGRAGKLAPAGRSEAFLRMAQEHSKPVIIAEASASRVEITASLEDGRKDWEAWFAPFFAFLAANPGVKAFHYINVDWAIDGGDYAEAGWRDARVNANAEILRRWIEELRKEKYLHLPDVGLLRGVSAAPAAAGTR